MPARILPDRTELEHMLRRGMTHQEIADAVTRETGHQVSRSSVSAAIVRAGLSQPSKKYPEEIPWTVREQHLTHYAARMLRTLGRRRAGLPNSLEMDARLDAWLQMLEENEAVVYYHRDTPQGWFYIHRSVAGGVHPEIPVAKEFKRSEAS